jgi:CheY-like chemotaxis protein
MTKVPNPPMLDHEDLKWIATASTDLNSILQQISRYSDLARRHKGQSNYIDLLGERVELAAKTAQALFDRVTSKILENATATSVPAPAAPHTPFTVLPPPIRTNKTDSSGGSRRIVEEAISKLTAAVANATGAKPASPAGSSVVPDDIKVKNPNGNRELILFIEDEVEVAEVAADLLAKEGYKIIVVHDGFEALKVYERIGPQIGLVILDFFLPILDGDAVFDELRALNPNVNVVLSSGFAEQSKISSMLSQGLRGFIPKPYTADRLLGQVRSTLDASRRV